MSLISRTNPIRLMAKRKISMVVNPDLQANQTVNTQEHHLHPQDTKITKPQTVSQFIGQFSAKVPTFKTIEGKFRVTTHTSLSETQIALGRDVRSGLQKKEYKRLLKLAHDIPISKIYDPLTKGLTREELTIFFKTLIDGQISEIENFNQLKFIVSTEEYNQLVEKSKESAQTISFLYLSMLKNGFKFTPYEYELFLGLEANNYRTSQANELIFFFENNEIPKTITFWNLKLRVQGNADPGNWAFTSPYYTLSRRGLFGGFEGSVQFGNLLTDLSQDIGNVIPNLETHKLIIAGAGKHNNLELVRHHIHDFWGIASQGQESESTPKVEVNSALYPDNKLLETIVAAFGVNSQLFEALHYITEFQHHYRLDLSRANYLWKLFINWTEMTNPEDPETSAKIFESVWSLMKSNNVTFNIGHYNKRRKHLVAQNKLDELISDLNEVRNHAKIIYDGLKLKAFEKLLSNQYQSCCSIVLSTGIEEEFDLGKLAEEIALSKFHLRNLEKIYEDELKLTDTERERFSQLQQEYDEQDDEDSLW